MPDPAAHGPFRSKLHFNIWKLGWPFGPKEFQNLCLNNIAVVATDNPMVVFCIKRGWNQTPFGPSYGEF